MTPDPVIDEIRRVRHEISRESGHDLRRMKDALTSIETQFVLAPIVLGKQRKVERAGVVDSGQTVTNNLSSAPVEL